jgi:hypothetical protein
LKLKLIDKRIISNESSSTYYRDWFIDVSITGYKPIAASCSINQTLLVVYSFRLLSDNRIQVGIRTNSGTGNFNNVDVYVTVLYMKSSFIQI